MKKILYSVMALAIAAMTFTACEDVPEPYPYPVPKGGTGALPYTSANLNTGWTLVEVTADAQPWSKGNSYAQATGYQKWNGASEKSNKAVEGWLISPAISTVGYENVKLSFNHTIKYTNNVSGWEAYHKVYASTDFDGTNASTATWKELAFTPIASPYSDWTLYSSGEIQLPAELIGKETVYIGFWFKAPEKASTTWELQTFKMEEGVAETSDTPDTPTDEGLGTEETPLTVAKALEIINGYEAAGESKSDAYVKGKIVSVQSYNSTYKSITYYISDDGTATNQLQVYSGKGLNGADFASANDLKPGAVVVVKGKLKKYVKGDSVTPEINQSSTIISIEGNEGSGDTPTPSTPSGNNLLSNGDFETWTNGQPTNWKSTTTASNANLSQSTEAHGGSFAVKVGHDANANKRISYQEITLKAGSYVMAFYVKASSSEGASVRPGFTDVVDGKANSSYTYGDYVNDISTEWQQVTHSFTLSSQTTVNILVMVPKNSGSDPIIDDFTLTTNDGGLADGSSGGGDTPSGDIKTVTIAEFNAATESNDIWYKLTGTVKNLKDGDQYGNFDIEDATGTVYVYGLLSEKGGEKKKFQELVAAKGIKEGSKITIIGVRGSYNGKIEVMNAYFVSIESGGGGDTPSSETKAVTVAEFNAAAESTDVWYQLTGTVKNLKEGDQYGNFDLEDSTGSVYVYGVLSEKGGAKKQFQTLASEKGIKNGSMITIIGNRGSYNGKIEVLNAYFVNVSN